MSFFGRIHPAFMWAAIAVCIFLNVVNINLLSMSADQQRANTVTLCERVAPTTDKLNLANGTFHEVLQTSLNNALNRINTPKELPSDKKTVQDDQTYLPKFQTTPPLNCKGFK